LRVAFIDQTGADIGGAQLSLSLLLKHLPIGVDPHAVFFHEGAFAESIRASGIPTSVIRLGSAGSSSTRERPRIEAALEVPAIARSVARLLRERRIDVVHTNTIKAHVFGSVGARLAGLPCVAHLRDNIWGLGLFGVRSTIAACTKERIAISGAVARTFNLKNTSIVKNPLDLSLYKKFIDRREARLRLGIPDDGIPVVGIVGRLNRWKGHDRFLRAIANVKATAKVHALVVGSAVFRDTDFLLELHALAESLGIRESVTFVDWVDDPRDVYAALDVHVNASTKEPFGRTTIEAAAMGVPTVCFDDSGVSESMIEGVTGIVVEAGNDDEMSAAIRYYVVDEQKRRAAGAAARTWSTLFDARRHAITVCDILESTRSRRPSNVR